MIEEKAQAVQVLEVKLHDQIVGHLYGFEKGRNLFRFANSFLENDARPTLSLVVHPRFPNAQKVLEKPWVTHHRLPPFFSNLLPEGVLRELLAKGLKAHMDNEFRLLAALGQDLPGALVVKPLQPEDVPESLIPALGQVEALAPTPAGVQNKFSLAGVQVKFSMKAKDGRYLVTQSDELGDWIVKTPSTQHQDVPLNEFTAMSLARIVGVEIPDIRLIHVDKLDNLPPLRLPDESYAYAIKRFDRAETNRIHTEDFAQVFVKYPHEKYGAANYEQVGQVLYTYTGDGLKNVQQFARRLLVNILLGNGDAHLKNWSLIYEDQFTPMLSPAYDIVTTCVYIEGEAEFALNLAKIKSWQQVSLAHFQSWSQKVGVPWPAIRLHLEDTIDRARTLWPQALKGLPMNPGHQKVLIDHWSHLHKDFQIL